MAITTTFYFDPYPIQEIARFVRDRSPDTKIVVGGPHIFNVCSDNAVAMQDTLLREIGFAVVSGSPDERYAQCG